MKGTLAMLRVLQQTAARRGSTLVEAALVISALVFLFLAIAEYGRFVMVKHVVDNATREGARLAASSNPGDTNSFNYQTSATVQNRVLAALAGQDKALTGLNIQVYEADASGNKIGTWSRATIGQNIAVQVDATYQPILPGWSLPFFNTKVSLLPSSGVPVFAKVVTETEGNN
jgi:Flp pilus assembly protein TadG